MANHHLVPKNDVIRRELKHVSVGDVVILSGFLVDIAKADGFRWTSSLSREDSGDGACELLWVDEVKIE